MERKHETILVTGVAASGNTTISNVLSNFGDKINVIDIELYGEIKFDTISNKPLWHANIKDIKAAHLVLEDKPTFIVGSCDNIDELIKMFDYYIVYLIDYNAYVVSESLNLRYDEADDKEKIFLQTLYGVKYHDVESVNKIGIEIKQKVMLHQTEVYIQERPNLDIISDITTLLDSNKI